LSLRSGEIDRRALGAQHESSWISRSREEGAVAIHILRLLDFFVFGTKPGAGNIAMTSEVDAVIVAAGSA
jgi:hypothetical protein